MGSFDFFEETEPRKTAENTATAVCSVVANHGGGGPLAVKVNYTITSNIMLFLFYTLFHFEFIFNRHSVI